MAAKEKEIEKTTWAEEFSLKDFLQICVRRWYWFLLSMVFCLGCGILFIMTRQPEYERSEELLIKDQDSGGGIGDIADAFSSFGLVSSNTSVYNELISLKSPAVMQEVVIRLRLYMDYEKRGGIHPVTLYGKNLPFSVEMQSIGVQEGASFRVRLCPDGSRCLSRFERHTLDGREKLDGEVVAAAGDVSVKTPVGIVKFTDNPDYTGPHYENEIEIDVRKSALQSVVEKYCEKLKGDLVDQDADVIGLSIRDVSVEKATDILDMILVVYNENWIEDKNKMAVATSAFIDERLRLIQKELGDVDNTIAGYSSSIGTPDLMASAQMALEKESKLEQSVLELNNQLALTQYMREFLEDSSRKYDVIPVNTGIENNAVEKDILTYNTLLLARNNLVANSSEKNPLVEDYDAQLGDMRKSIKRSVDSQIAGIKALMKNVNSERSKTSGSISSTSEKALPLLSEERQQKVKEGLYLFLLQKREENELSRKFTADNVRIITPPMGSLKPVSPRKMLIMIVAFILGAGIPFTVVYLVETSNTKVRSKSDLEGVSLPFAGEIPQVGKRGKLKNLDKLGKKGEEKRILSVVGEGKRDVVNEAFRVIRSNIEFMSRKTQTSPVIMITSFNPGSGKSFVSYNLGLSFSLKKKRVLVIDCDMRHGSASLYVGNPKKGLSDYLGGNYPDWKELVKDTDNGFLSVLPVGKIPPNPAELLDDSRFETLVAEAKESYDYIFLDCPPVDIVVDTQIVGIYADRTLFVVRAGLLERNALRELEEFYEENKFRNMSIILNGTEPVHSRYYTYGNYQSYE